MSQTSYSQYATIAFAGMRADNGQMDVHSAVNEGATAVPFGAIVKRGTVDRSAELLTDPLESALAYGLSLHSHAYGVPDELDKGTPGGVAQESMLSVLREGRAYVAVEGAVAPGGSVWMNPDGSGFAAADGGGYVDVSANCGFITTTTAAGFAVLEVDFRTV